MHIDNSNKTEVQKPKTREEIALFFLSSGLFCLPLLSVYMTWDTYFDNLSNTHEILYFAEILFGAGVVVGGMYAATRFMGVKIAGLAGLACWLVLFVITWSYSSSM